MAIKNPIMTWQTVFIVDTVRPWRQLLCVNCRIVSGKKFTWAQFQDRDGVTIRRLLGATAFYTLPGAIRCQKSHLRQRIESRFVRWAHPEVAAICERKLAQINGMEDANEDERPVGPGQTGADVSQAQVLDRDV